MGMSIEEEVKNIKEQLADVSAKYRMMQADYNARLKADMVAMLTELMTEIEELKSYESADGQDLAMIADIGILLQQKIDALKGEQA